MVQILLTYFSYLRLIFIGLMIINIQPAPRYEMKR
jgi:hypothetical protein